jgi:transposase
MMGQLPAAQNALFYEFSLEHHIPDDHLLRQIDQLLDFDAIRQHLTPHYSHTGRPSIDPELMIRMLLLGYCYGIRSERRLCEEVNFNLAYRWFCRLGLEDTVPDHSTFSKNRHGRFRDSYLLRYVFNTVVVRCVEEGLVGGEGFAIDASLVRADASKQRREDSPVDWTPSKVQSRAVKEYLEILDQDDALNRKQKCVSLTDPMAQWPAAGGSAYFFYSTNYLIDVDNSIIMDVEGTPSHRQLEVSTTRTMLERVESLHEMRPERLMGDTAYGAADNLHYLVSDKNIEPHIPVWDKRQRKDDTFSINDFIWCEEKDEYRCPSGKSLRSRRRALNKSQEGTATDNTIRYRSKVADCRHCPLKQRCCPNTPYRKIARSLFEKSRDVARAISKSDKYFNTSFHDWKKVEMQFAHMKHHLRFDRLRLRGLRSANDEFLLVATVQNLRRMARLLSQPPPADGVSASGFQKTT